NQVGHVTTVNTVNGRGQPTQITDPNGIVSNLTYDFQGRLLTVTVNPGATQAVTTLTYDGVGDITRITRPDGSFLSYTYNDARRLTTVTNNTGETINYTYDLLGGVTSRVIKSTAGAITFSQTQTFDELGRLLKHIGGDFNQTTTFAYEKNNNLKSITDPRSGLYSYGYDSLNRLITTTDQENSVVTLTRDGQDNTTAYKDPRNLTTTYVRNGFGEIIQEISPDRGSTVTFRDARGLATTVYDGRGIGVIITYDNAGRILTKTYPAATAENATYTYDDLTGGNVGKGRLTRLTDQTGSIDFLYDVRGNVTQETRTISGQAHVVAYAYDLADRIAQITYPSGRIVTYTRDTTGRITAVATKQTATAAPVTVASAITYQPMSNLPTYLAYGNGLGETALHTRDYEIYAITVVDGANVVFNIGYARLDKLNITNASSSPNPAHSFSAGYTGANRLGYISGVYGSKSYTFDGVGNRTNEMTTVGSTTTSDNYFLLPNTNRVGYVNRAGTTIRTLTYDNAGNLLTDAATGGSKAYTYNKRNRLSVATVGALTYTYTYNALEQLASRVASSPAATTHFIHDRWGNVIAETAGGGATGTTGTVREYIYLYETEIAPTMSSRTVVDRPLAVIDAVNTSPVTYWVSVDHLHRPVKLTNAAKASVWDAVWLPWGGVQSITGTVTLNTRFPGQWFQTETGLHYNWHRHYDPTLGSYTQPDPLGFVDGPSVYGYAGGNPQALVDPDGRSAAGATGVLGGPAGWVLGGAATYCAIFPDACRKILEQCLNFFFDSSGRSPPAPPPPPPPPKRDYDCEKDWLRDHKWCSKKYWGINASIGVACHAWANNNLYRCLAGTQRQPWSEVGAKR
ncbi:MAG: hypothetical protein K2Y05_05645, partial [Hyphomicrobiaceae bacterium]|nr:hypothetical protein [Hyphomicrobiaceae bacterium]